MAKIKSIYAFEILDSRGIPTIQAHLETDTGIHVQTEVSSGMVLSQRELVELRDNDPNHFDGRGVKKAVYYINSLIGPKLKGVDVSRIFEIDEWLIQSDNTTNRSNLGANTIIAISFVCAKAGAACYRIPLYQYLYSLFIQNYGNLYKIEHIPAPIVNVINGGIHGSGVLDFQEFHVIPSTSYHYLKAIELSVDIYREIKHLLERKNVGVFLSEQGGYIPQISRNIDALEVIKEAILIRKKRLGVDIFTSIDCAANFFYKENSYPLHDQSERMTPIQYKIYLKSIIDQYSILYIEDPFYEDSFESWKSLVNECGDKSYIAGDDLISGSLSRLKKAISEQLCNSVVLKCNQFSTISELFVLVKFLKEKNIKIILSQRYGETNDTILSDIAVGIQADFVKFGSPNRGERVAKYNRLIEICHLFEKNYE